MYNSYIKGIGHYLPDNVVTNADLEKIMDTTDEWIRERTGIEERRWVKEGDGDTGSVMGAKAARAAIADAGIDKSEIDFIIFATLSPDLYFPGNGVLVEQELGLNNIGALDIRNQCSGFIYGLSVADQFVKTGMYKNILLIGSELHSGALDKTTRGRNVSVIFGDGAGAAVISRAPEGHKGILASCMHSQGEHHSELAIMRPSTSFWLDKYLAMEDPDDGGSWRPYMNGNFVFKHAVTRMPEAIGEVLQKAQMPPEAIDLVIPHQANLRISQMVQRLFKLPDDKVYNNIQKVGNTTAGSIPIALSQARDEGKAKRGDLLCLTAFGAGFTWGATLLEF